MAVTVGWLGGPVRFVAAGRFVSGPGWRHVRRTTDDFEVVFVRRGVLPVEVGGVRRDIVAGQVALWPPRVEHAGTHAIDEYLEYYWLHFRLDDYAVQDDGDPLPRDEGFLVLPESSALADPDRLAVWFNQLLDLYVTHGPAHNPYCDYCATVALLEISAQTRAALTGRDCKPKPAHNVGAIAADAFRMPQQPGRNGARGVADMQAVRSWIQANAFESITVADVAARFHYSPSYLTSLYRRAYGMGVVEQISAYRIERARELLGSTSLPVASVAAAVGYADPRYFMRVFKRHTGLTPTQYRVSFPGKLFNSE